MALRELDDGAYVSRIKDIPDVIKVRLNSSEKKALARSMAILEQPKHSTALKQLALEIGANVVHEGWVARLLQSVFENKRKNQRTGYDAEYV